MSPSDGQRMQFALLIISKAKPHRWRSAMDCIDWIQEFAAAAAGGSGERCGKLMRQLPGPIIDPAPDADDPVY